ncbi:MAG: RDD family protein [Actinomycetota bacterium]
MMNDSVREELKPKISFAPNTPKSLKTEISQNLLSIEKSNMPMLNKPKPQLLPKPEIPIKPNTTEIAAKPTSPTLVEFQNKNATLPDWRLQLQNAVRKRVENIEITTSAIEVMPRMSRLHLPTSGANALKAEYIEEAAPAANSNPKLANALRRIEESRKRFLAEEISESAPKVESAAGKNYPFYIATKNAEVMPKPPEMKTSVNFSATPKIDDLPVIEKIEKKEYDTNKLKPLPNSAIISTSLEKVSGNLPEIEGETKDAPFIKITRVKSDEDEILDLEETELAEEAEEIDDIAPLAMRFNAGLFDLIIGAFTSLVLLAPFMLSGGKWLSLAGFLAFLVTCAIVMFIYLTTTIGMFGKTLGMKIFSLETIDIEENDYPTFHQAAVSSSVYLVSLALGGIGFLPALFNDEKRTAPDLLSGTIVVKEY